MGRRTDKTQKSQTLPSSPTHSFSSSSSSDFEFRISISPRKSSNHLCPADELFYKGQILPLHLSPRLSMVRTLLLSSSSTSSSSDTTATASRDSSGSSNDSHWRSDLLLLAECDSSRPSSATEEDEFKRHPNQIKKTKFLSLSRFSSVFRKEPKPQNPDPPPSSSVKRMSEVIRKYLKKAKPLYDKLSQRQQQKMAPTTAASILKTDGSMNQKRDLSMHNTNTRKEHVNSHSFSGNLRYPRKRSYVASCPSSMRSSPSHSGVLHRSGSSDLNTVMGMSYANSSSMDELQSAIQGAIAHCKNSMLQNKGMVSNEI